MLSTSAAPIALNSISGELPPVPPGTAFWLDNLHVANMVGAGLAVIAPGGTVPPPSEPPYMVNGVAGLGRATQNASPA